jgi:hypothetical protein
MTVKKNKQLNELDRSLKALANLTNNKKLYGQATALLVQLWMGNKYGLKDIHEFTDLAEYNWLKNRKSQAQKQELTIVK